MVSTVMWLYLPVFLIMWRAGKVSSNDQCNFIPEVNFPNGRKAGKRLDGFTVLNVTAGTPVKCFAKCTEHCQCKSVNVCGKTCQLNSGKEEGAVLTDSSDCTYYEVSWIERNSYGGCGKNIRCCDYGNPCLYGGKCIEQCASSGKRYRCQCRPFFSGENCQITPKSCRTLYDFNPTLPSGKYSLYDSTGTSYTAFCDFTIDSGKVWTLVMSYTLGNNAHYSDQPLRNDNPRNENEANWKDYRLSKSRMLIIQNETTHWRMTCNYNTQSIADKVDYLRVNNAMLEMLNYDSNDYPTNNRCKMVEYLNIRGGSCSQCSVAISQSTGMLSINNYYNDVSSCDWRYPNGYHLCTSPRYLGEYNFGAYVCINRSFRCTFSSSSTTQMWFGS